MSMTNMDLSQSLMVVLRLERNAHDAMTSSDSDPESAIPTRLRNEQLP